MVGKALAEIQFDAQWTQLDESHDFTNLDITFEQLAILKDLKRCVSQLTEIYSANLAKLICKMVTGHNQDTDDLLKYMSETLPEARIIDVGKMILSVQIYFEGVIGIDKAKGFNQILDEWFQGFIRDYTTRA
ncbi:MAG: hypothetical protein IH840_01210 [Candidatus Heimdallarchaeota archaeon]|nr:hypothetical protein [Candidatus Heimdallarchaeota archaeon]